MHRGCVTAHPEVERRGADLAFVILPRHLCDLPVHVGSHNRRLCAHVDCSWIADADRSSLDSSGWKVGLGKTILRAFCGRYFDPAGAPTASGWARTAAAVLAREVQDTGADKEDGFD